MIAARTVVFRPNLNLNRKVKTTIKVHIFIHDVSGVKPIIKFCKNIKFLNMIFSFIKTTQLQIIIKLQEMEKCKFLGK